MSPRQFITDGFHQVSFTQSRPTIKKEWVVFHSWVFNDIFRHRNCEVIIRTDDEIVHGKFFTKTGPILAAGI